LRHAKTSALPSRTKRPDADWKSIAGGAAAGPTFRDLLLRTCFAVSVTGYDPSRQPMASKYFRKTRKFRIAAGGAGLLKLIHV